MCSWGNDRLDIKTELAFICTGWPVLVKAILMEDYCMGSRTLAFTCPYQVRSSYGTFSASKPCCVVTVML
jgi:hypothetical protein